MHTLYLKKHDTTGKLYLGWTTRDVETYSGSGVYWLKHLKKHGNFVSTVVLEETADLNRLRSQGKYYSELWDVADNPQFANLKEEDGVGGNYGAQTRQRMSQSAKERVARMGPPTGGSPQARAEHSARTKTFWADPENKKKRREAIKRGKAASAWVKPPSSDETKKKQSDALKGRKLNLGMTYKMKPVECPHCGTKGSGGNMTRYHFDKCRSLQGVT